MCAYWAAAAAAEATTGLEERNNSQYTHCRRPCVSLIPPPSFISVAVSALLLPTYFSIPCSTHTHTHSKGQNATRRRRRRRRCIV